jgi:nucleotide-binding universal stress UspA family protein
MEFGEPEEHAFRLHQIDPIIESLQEAGKPIELDVHSSISMTRGILDATREMRADILLLDARLPAEGGAKRGTIAENIIPVSPCPVMLYRPGESRKVGRIVVPIQGGREAHTASELAMALGQRLKAPVEALFLEIESPVGEPAYWNDEKQRQATSFDQSEVTQSVVNVEDHVEGFLQYAEDEDLAVADNNEQADWQDWMRGDSSLEALRRWPGAFLVNASGAVTLPRSWEDKVTSWLNPTVTQFEGEELVRDAEESSFSSLDFLVLIIISAVLAAFGLILNSNAVIIGAMLVAPLMTPLIALATGLVVGNIRIMRQGAITLRKCNLSRYGRGPGFRYDRRVCHSPQGYPFSPGGCGNSRRVDATPGYHRIGDFFQGVGFGSGCLAFIPHQYRQHHPCCLGDLPLVGPATWQEV